MTTKEDIRKWFKEAKKENATHMLVVCDTYEWDDYPVSVLPGQDIKKVIKNYSKNMQRVEEVYNIKIDMEEQLSQNRVWNVKIIMPKTRTNIIKTMRKNNEQ